MKTLKALFPLILLTACQAGPARVMTPVAPFNNVNNVGQMRAPVSAQNVATRGLTKSEFTYSGDKTELTVIMVHDTGETVETKTIRNPLTGNKVSAETTTKRNGAVVSKRATTPAEADLTVKVAANNGWQDVYRDLKARYQLAGLIS